MAYIHSMILPNSQLIPMTFFGDETPEGMRVFESLSDTTIRPSHSLYSLEGSYGWRVYQARDQRWWVRDQLCGYLGVKHFIWFASAKRLAEKGVSHFEKTALHLVSEQIQSLKAKEDTAELFVCLLPSDQQNDTLYALSAQAKVREALVQANIPQVYQVKVSLPGTVKSSLLRVLDHYAKDESKINITHPHIFVDDWVHVRSGEVVGENGETFKLEQDFALGQTAVTQSLYEAVMGVKLPLNQGPLYPATAVSWIDSVSFCNQLSELLNLPPYYEIDTSRTLVKVLDPKGIGIRLPKRHEWCYAACGGRSWPYAGSDLPDEVAWSAHNSGSKVRPVARLKHNDLGLYDMSGNVWEWCEEGTRDHEQNEICSGDHHPKWLLGGSWANHPWVFPIGETLAELPSYRDQFMGFRIARNVSSDTQVIAWSFSLEDKGQPEP